MRIRINEAQDLDEINITLQKILAFLADQNIHSLDRCNLYFTPLKPSGNEKTMSAQKLDCFEVIADKPKQGGGSRKKGYKYKS